MWLPTRTGAYLGPSISRNQQFQAPTLAFISRHAKAVITDTLRKMI
ncbi:hypothetical protein SNOG_10123 [Parastagonospora nodorum SN15]|uniref:Uncharacterized protein n=1 Tax=Phaeosphaeria nodorum (strain SN15 / ATCC MYA-4574 / FGSC 10173) TaxID=321614 RepID=Q0UDP1_PHANO|nr:hypothetical protein SNOG_10123 [Parastagonospora nodorum SN15]EAT82458.1 hypothetical protein SNOG_10123 [Parastagonospora nodorum SN15]